MSCYALHFISKWYDACVKRVNMQLFINYTQAYRMNMGAKYEYRANQMCMFACVCVPCIFHVFGMTCFYQHCYHCSIKNETYDVTFFKYFMTNVWHNFHIIRQNVYTFTYKTIPWNGNYSNSTLEHSTLIVCVRVCLLISFP